MVGIPSASGTNQTLTTFTIVLIFHRSLISQIWNQFVKLIQLKFEPLCCHAHGQHASADVFQPILSKQLFRPVIQ